MSILPDSLDTVARKIREALPDDLEDLGQDLKKNLRARLDGALSHLDLVTREEFEVERELVSRLSQRIESLAAKIDALGPSADATDKRSHRKAPKE